MPPTGEESPNDDEVDLDAVRSDLSDMQSSIEDHHALLDRGPELRESHFIESQVDVDVPPVVAGYVRAVVREAATMTVEERDQFLYEELLGFKTFKRHGNKNGCHVVTVSPDGTTKRCARCDVESDKAIWVREHSCPSCGFEADRDGNASYNVQKLGLEELSIEYDVDAVVGLGEAESTPAETALPTGADASDSSSFRLVSAKRVVETGSHGSPDPW